MNSKLITVMSALVLSLIQTAIPTVGFANPTPVPSGSPAVPVQSVSPAPSPSYQPSPAPNPNASPAAVTLVAPSPTPSPTANSVVSQADYNFLRTEANQYLQNGNTAHLQNIIVKAESLMSSVRAQASPSPVTSPTPAPLTSSSPSPAPNPSPSASPAVETTVQLTRENVAQDLLHKIDTAFTAQDVSHLAALVSVAQLVHANPDVVTSAPIAPEPSDHGQVIEVTEKIEKNLDNWNAETQTGSYYTITTKTWVLKTLVDGVVTSSTVLAEHVVWSQYHFGEDKLISKITYAQEIYEGSQSDGEVVFRYKKWYDYGDSPVECTIATHYSWPRIPYEINYWRYMSPDEVVNRDNVKPNP